MLAYVALDVQPLFHGMAQLHDRIVKLSALLGCALFENVDGKW